MKVIKDKKDVCTKRYGRLFLIPVFIYYIFALLTTSGIEGLENKIDQSKLIKILEKTAHYCKNLEDISLYYFCQENVKETIYPLPKKYRGITGIVGIHGHYPRFHDKPSIVNEYLYEYQLIRKGKKKIRERRILLEENGEEKNVKNARLKTQCFKYTKIINNPQVFNKEEQRFYNFKILRMDKLKGRNVLVIQALPQPGVQKKLTWGEFWVDESNFSILKIKMAQRSIWNYHKIERIAQALNADPNISIIMDYDIEKNGIMFPSTFILKEEYIPPNGEAIILSMLEVKYEKYKFFTVGVDITYDKGSQVP
jgi:hypothetical protein